MKQFIPGLMSFLALNLTVALAAAQGTGFTYNGRLTDAGQAANGAYDMSFTLYDAENGGNTVGNPLPLSPVTVVNGLFAVNLDFGDGIFTGAARWLEVSVRRNGDPNFTILAPRQGLTSSPYAIFAGKAGAVADNGIGGLAIQDASVLAGKIAAGQVVKTLNGLTDAVTLKSANQNLTITEVGNNVVLSAVGGGGSGLWGANGLDAFYTAGKVGIGTSTPGALLHLAGSQDALHVTGFEPLITLFDSNHSNARNVIQSVNGGLNVLTENYLNGSDPFGFLRLDGNGNLGIGSAQPVGKLEVVGQDAVRIIGYQPFLTFYDSDSGYARGRIQSAAGGINQFAESYLNGSNPFGFMRLDANGNVGIGSAQPVGKLEVVGQDAVRMIGYQPFLTLYDSNAGYARSRVQGVNGNIAFQTEAYIATGDPAQGLMVIQSGSGNVGLGTSNPQAKLDVNGVTRTKVLTITGGADVAEPFDIAGGTIPKGSVVVIDDDHPGQLRLSTEAYDKRVAGIVSGANGIHPGISIAQEGVNDSGQDVALSGRVYVLADASGGEIRPGDMLTSSDTPGHAMKVRDHQRAQGAVLGKAMSGLKKGRGHVLVLVTLQ